MGTGNPNSIPGFGLDRGSAAIPKAEGAFHYYSIQPRIGGLASGGTQLTVGINLNPFASAGPQVDWMSAEKQKYMVSPNDINEFEMTRYVRVSNVIKQDDITMRFGGQHTGSNNPLAGSFGEEFAYSGGYGKTFENELNHPRYEFFSTPVSLKTGDLANRWIGMKTISIHTSAGQLYYTYVDLDGIDTVTGLPKNHWQHLATYLDAGKEGGMYAGHISSWG
jgi:hypothetical protein